METTARLRCDFALSRSFTPSVCHDARRERFNTSAHKPLMLQCCRSPSANCGHDAVQKLMLTGSPGVICHGVLSRISCPYDNAHIMQFSPGLLITIFFIARVMVTEVMFPSSQSWYMSLVLQYVVNTNPECHDPAARFYQAYPVHAPLACSASSLCFSQTKGEYKFLEIVSASQ